MFFLSSPDRLLILSAILPAAILLVYIYKQDRLEKEPVSLVLSLVLWGILSTFLAALTEELGMGILGALFERENVLSRVLMYFVVVGLSEEGFKYLLLRKKTWKSPHFNCQFDAVVYAVSVSLGFALWENIGYVVSYGMQAALARAITAVPGHACFGVFMGAFYGVAKESDNRGFAEASLLWRVLSVLVPSLIHGCYDFIATAPDLPAGVFMLFLALVLFTAFVTVRILSRKDRFIDRRGFYF